MARYFEISSSTPTVSLDSQGHGTVQYKVKNVSSAPVDGRAVLVSLPAVNPAAGAVQNDWVKLEAPADHHFEKDEQAVFSVKIEVPQKDRSKTGTYTFRLDFVLLSIPDRGDQGPATAFTVKGSAPKPNVLLWVIPVLVLLFLGTGLGIWLHTRDGGPKVPDVTGKSIAEATASLVAAKYTVDPKTDTTADAKADPNKVFSTTPSPGTKAAQSSVIRLMVGTWTKVANERDTVYLPKGTTYRFGVDTRYLAPVTTTVDSNLFVVWPTFGSDPAYGASKELDVAGNGTGVTVNGVPFAKGNTHSEGPGIAPSGRVQIVNNHSGLCITPAGGGRNLNGDIVQYRCDEDPSRIWTFKPIDDDIVEIVSLNTELCLALASSSTSPNAVAVQSSCDGDGSRRWHYKMVDSTTIRFVNVNSGLCLTVAGGSMDLNLQSVQYPCDGDPSRDWHIRPSS